MLLSYMYAQDVIEPDTHWRAIPSSHRRCVSFLAHLICGMSCVTDGNRSPSPRSVIIFCALFASPTRPKGDDVADCVHRKGAVISRPSVAWRPIVLLYCYCCWISAELLLYVLSLSLSLSRMHYTNRHRYRSNVDGTSCLRYHLWCAISSVCFSVEKTSNFRQFRDVWKRARRRVELHVDLLFVAGKLPCCFTFWILPNPR